MQSHLSWGETKSLFKDCEREKKKRVHEINMVVLQSGVWEKVCYLDLKFILRTIAYNNGFLFLEFYSKYGGCLDW